MNKNNKKILQNLITYYVDNNVVSLDDTLKLSGPSSNITLTYGETYDIYGITVDSLKYYFFLSVLTTLFERIGTTIKSSIIVGDVASVRNKNVPEEEIKKKIKENIVLISKIKTIYALPLEFIQMSTLFQTSNFQKRLESVKNIYEQSAEMKKLALSTVMTNRVKQENEVGFLYSLEEVALILDCDIKVGAKREINYDNMANIVRNKLNFKPLTGIYLKPTYPIGVQFDYFLQHPEIEEYGLTPYKAGSNKMQDNRFILGKTSLKDLKKLMDISFYHNDLSLPNSVRDLYLIGLLAKVIYSKNLDLLKQDYLFGLPSKNDVLQLIGDYVYKPLGLE